MADSTFPFLALKIENTRSVTVHSPISYSSLGNEIDSIDVCTETVFGRIRV
jgi:hypothetical protein